MKRRALPLVVMSAVLGTLAAFGWYWRAYPSDRTPEGAYLRIVSAMNRDRPEEFFAYLETPAQHACFTIRNYRREARERILASYPEPARSEEAARHEALARAADGAEAFATMARERGWLGELRRDLSGISSVQIRGERATIETARGTRYSFRLRDNGIWGLTLFTAELAALAEKAARDASIIEQAALDYGRAARAAPQ